AAYQDRGFYAMRPGSLVKARGETEVAVVSEGQRLPIQNWTLFLALGYEAPRIVELDPQRIDELAFPRGPVISSTVIQACSGKLEESQADFQTANDAGMLSDVGIANDASIADFAFADQRVLPDLETKPISDFASWADLQNSAPDFATSADLKMKPDLIQAEICNGIDDNGNGLIDEPFSCAFGTASACQTVCGSMGTRECQLPFCEWGLCRVPFENCQNGIDDDCDGKTDCADPDCAGTANCLPPVIRYEFRVLDSAGWQAAEPFRLRDEWWMPVVCLNTGTQNMETVVNGWRRCDQRPALSPFVGSFFSLAHPTWGDAGNLGTIGNTPARCTATAGVEWRILNMRTNQLIYQGGANGLPCASIGTQDRHALPPY
ncbi:MAG TPA: hypothetical protein VFQ60_03960, partial [Patescibacteria group bacterium]|nr:hypothetical protein [Patescibacteria group bacterium]